ncbi:MAG: RecX family transcriptional regulator [Bacteroidales bacterium]|nr:RecX family transcriptional regulator [Bacteroidales bacterium]MBR5703339.1 RecX family transcriptional regulator [Bacteroidales bacterium]
MERAKAIERMRGICSRKECCRQEIAAKLEKLEVEDVSGAVEQLCKEGFIDERRYARAFARDKSSLQGWGSLKIKLALQRKGIEAEVISAALEEIDAEAASAKLESLLRAKLRTLRKEEDSTTRRAKVFRYALGRGYGYDQINKVYNDICRTT